MCNPNLISWNKLISHPTSYIGRGHDINCKKMKRISTQGFGFMPTNFVSLIDIQSKILESIDIRSLLTWTKPTGTAKRKLVSIKHGRSNVPKRVKLESL